MKKRERRGFDEQFRREAVRLAESGTMPIAEVARQLGVHAETLRNWRRDVQQLPAGVMTSLTWDRGTEMAQHKVFAVATDVAVYFCDPQSPWQRGTNENTNGLLRQYFPTGTDLSTYTQCDLNAIARKLNTRPRKTLGFQTPGAILAKSVALTG